MEATHGFFTSRRPVNLRQLKGGGKEKPFAEYKNVPAITGTLVSSRLATLHELDTVYGVEDAYNLLEVVTIDGYNKVLANQE